MEESVWYCAIGERQLGPLTLEQLQQMRDSGQLAPQMLVWRPGMPPSQ